MDQRNIASQLLKSVESMVDPNATVDQQLSQMRAQLAALAELPQIINKKLDSVNKKISQISMESVKKEVVQEHYIEIARHNDEQQNEVYSIMKPKHSVEITELEPDEELRKKEIEIRVTKPSLTEEELQLRKEELKRLLEDKARTKKEYSSQSEKQASVKVSSDQRIAPRRKPEPQFGPVVQERPLYLPGGRRWRVSEYDEEQISETLTSQAEVIKGNAIGVNFKKFEKPPITLDHLQRSEVFRAVHNMDDTPLKKVELLRPAIAASEIRERARSVSPGIEGR